MEAREYGNKYVLWFRDGYDPPLAAADFGIRISDVIVVRLEALREREREEGTLFCERSP